MDRTAANVTLTELGSSNEHRAYIAFSELSHVPASTCFRFFCPRVLSCVLRGGKIRTLLTCIYKDKRHLPRLINTAENVFAKCTLLLNLFEQNNENGSRLSTRSTIVGKPNMMSYEHIVQAQQKRDAKGARQDRGAGRGSKRTTSTPIRAASKRLRKNELEVAALEIEALGSGNYCTILQC